MVAAGGGKGNATCTFGFLAVWPCLVIVGVLGEVRFVVVAAFILFLVMAIRCAPKAEDQLRGMNGAAPPAIVLARAC